MFKIAKIALVTMPLVAGAASTPAFAVNARNVAAGEAWARQMLQLMDTDKNGRVSRQEDAVHGSRVRPTRRRPQRRTHSSGAFEIPLQSSGPTPLKAI